jgi:hypothetical protein
MGTGSMSDAYGGIKVKQRPAPIHAVRFLGHNLVNIAQWLENSTHLMDGTRTEMYPGDAQPMLVIGDQRFCAGDWIVAAQGKVSRWTDAKFQAAFEVIE